MELNEDGKFSNKDFTPKYDLVPAWDPILREELARFDFNNPPVNPQELAIDLAEHMLHYGGIGLAANQLGLRHRVFAIRAESVIVMFNPVIVDETTKEISLEEGCLTFPNLFLKVKRPESIKIRYQLPNGEFRNDKYTGMTARIIQHELDHLDGVLFIDRVSNLVLQMAKKKAIKHGKKNLLRDQARL
jgi:peptide deformylase